MNNLKNPPPLPPPLPPYASEQSDLKTAFKLVAGIVGALTLFGIVSNGASDNAKVAAPVQTTVAAPVESSDPCGLAKRSGMTREACERLAAVQYRLWLEEELERNPNFKPYALKPNR